MLASFNKKNEDTDGNGSSQHSRFWGSTGLRGSGATTGNILADFLLRDMTFGFSEASTGRSAPQRWRDVEMYVADSWQVSRRFTFDYGVRYSLLYNPYTTDDKITSFVPSLFNPALGNDPCNGLLQPPGSNWCQGAGARGGADGPNRSLMEQDLNNFAPRLGFAWDVHGNGKTAVRGGIGQFFLRERLTPVLSIATNPPFVTTISGERKLDTTAAPCAGCFGSGLGAPTRGREVDMRTPNNWQWNLTYQQEVFSRSSFEVAYVANYGYDLLKISRGESGPERRHQRQRHGRSSRVYHHRTNAVAAAVRRVRQQQHRRVGSHRQVDVSLAADAVRLAGSAAARSSRPRTRCRARARTSR